MYSYSKKREINIIEDEVINIITKISNKQEGFQE